MDGERWARDSWVGRWGGGGGPGGSVSHGRGLVGFSFRWMDGWMGGWNGMEIKIEVGIRREVVR